MMMNSLPQQRAEIARLVPHAGSMCLLEQVVAADDRRIHCRTSTHHHVDNPLRHGSCLPVSAALEYAAQAAAVQGSLLLRGQPPRPGYLAVLSNIRWTVDRLDTIADALEIQVTREAEGEGGIDCHFVIRARERLLVEGNFVVAFA